MTDLLVSLLVNAISFEIGNLEKFSIQDVTHSRVLMTVSRHLGVIINQFIWSSLSSWRSLLLMALLYDCSQLLFRENVAAWICFYDRKYMFIKRVLYLKEWLKDHAFVSFNKTSFSQKNDNKRVRCEYEKMMQKLGVKSLEDDKVSKKVMRLASLHCWHSLSFGLF
ncbi:hypothetical protein L1987_08915 [Smallanthus sonchifolius]|uniref:Uncharacterized protein n=1 Tax=Smallanthus sonchifolius TaxID=185202 RepID=A0ACB9JLI9_9ASTR|nr:hypothetical protein L1987_08915 [Smallanthus sonchifolius]